jgi:hypothetical protein
MLSKSVVDVVCRRAPQGFEKLEDVIATEELAAIVGGYAKTAGFAVPTAARAAAAPAAE